MMFSTICKPQNSFFNALQLQKIYSDGQMFKLVALVAFIFISKSLF